MFLALRHELQRKLDLSFIFIADDTGVVRYFCDRAAVMKKGDVVELGPASRIRSAPEHPYAKALISAVRHPGPTARSTHLRHRYCKGGH